MDNKAVLLIAWIAATVGIVGLHFGGVFDQVGMFSGSAGALTMLIISLIIEETVLWSEANQDRFPSWLVELVGN